ncbi:MAG: hypothetical protein KBT35_05830 [Firmicutes bacterium]|nr:hypothetical protein [Candidatus Colivicinus equi]
MENKKLKLDFDMTIFDVVDLNKSFAAAKCLVCYTGRNRNYSDIGKNQILDAIPSMRNIPVVGRYDVEKNDFGSHDIKVINTEDGIDIVNATIPFGVVPESANQWFETRVVNGEERECFFTDIVLWKRQHGYEHIVEAGTISESMEIDVSEYVVDQDGYCIIDKFQFEALCLLGDSVTPCFENAHVQMYSNEIVSNFKLQFSEMLKEFKELNHSSTAEVDDIENNGGNSMAEEIKDEVVEEVTEEVVEENVGETVTEETPESETTDEATYSEETETEENTDESEKDNEEESATESESEEETTDETETVIEEESNDYSAMYEELKSSYDALEKEFADYKEAHSVTNEEVEELKAFKLEKETEARQIAENEVFSKYVDIIGETEEFSTLKENVSNYEIEALEKECLYIVGKYAITKTEKKETESLKFNLENRVDVEDEPYGGLMKKYAKKTEER